MIQKRAALYVRVSTQEQANEGYSVEAQQEKLEAYAKARGYIIQGIYIDPGYSGANTERPALQKLIRAIESNDVDIVTVYKLDRLSRSQKDTLHLIEDVLLKNKVDFVSMNESFDTSTPFGRAMIGILSVFAQLEREQIKERSLMGREQRAKAGLYHGGGAKRVVFGYDYIDGELIINPIEAQCVKEIYREYLNGKGVKQIFDYIGLKYPGVLKYESTCRKVLSNPIYYGMLTFKDKLYPGLHKTLITKEDFDMVQSMMKKKTSKTNPFARSYLLSGLTYCGQCGSRVAGRTGAKRKDGTYARYYRCYASQKSAATHMKAVEHCSQCEIRKDILEEYVIDRIKSLTPHNVESESIKNGRSNPNNDIENLRKQLSAVNEQISKLIDLYSLGKIEYGMIGEKVGHLQLKKQAIEEALGELELEDYSIDLDKIKNTVAKLPYFDWENSTTDEKRMLIASLVERVTIKDREMSLKWDF
ncbi:conserved hypothetical protein [Exiguobacterium sp. 8H]|uniref:recombinase family protein n=1 Tax=unclassified Exiguobacterium TaxID=2644629 RepID=UPI0012F2C71F|nr:MULTISPECIES: recombinase family protein [unclassified Exiguobacterium]VXB53161.1 conserved hypothetical protein [Exiguobacterium sp. 8A]VXB53798.1 conserved hypothetical protein [Exiguobacterium sp. 8H]